jgi:hypothetical protein
MFNWLKRRSEPKRPERAASKPSKQPPPQRKFEASRPPAVPEVVAEGNTEADWSAWEDSKEAWDSQLQGVQPSDRVYIRDTQSPPLDEEPDPFASVQRKRDR